MTLLELFALLRKRWRLLVILPVVFAFVTGLYSFLLLPNTYTASVSMYVLTREAEQTAITSSELTASQQLTNDVVSLIKSDRVKKDTASALNMTDLNDFQIKVDSSTSSRVITVSVQGVYPKNVASVANCLAETVDGVARGVMDVQSINPINLASEPTSPSGPPRLLYVAVAILIGLLAAIVVVVLSDALNTKVRSNEEAEELTGLPVIGRIPTFM